MNYQECPTMKVCRNCKEEKEYSDYSARCMTCKQCLKERYKGKVAEYYKNNSEAICKRTSAYYKANAEKYTEYKKDWRKDNPVKDAQAWSQRREADLPLFRAKEALNSSVRRVQKKLATPSWANKSKMLELHKEAGKKGFHVDHIVPLRHPLVCGLHCEDNLRVISPHENHTKSNKLIEDIV